MIIGAHDNMGPALDRWITGNYGEDQFKTYCDGCGRVITEPWDYPEGEEIYCHECREEPRRDDPGADRDDDIPGDGRG